MDPEEVVGSVAPERDREGSTSKATVRSLTLEVVSITSASTGASVHGTTSHDHANKLPSYNCMEELICSPKESIKRV